MYFGSMSHFSGSVLWAVRAGGGAWCGGFKMEMDRKPQLHSECLIIVVLGTTFFFFHHLPAHRPFNENETKLNAVDPEIALKFAKQARRVFIISNFNN